MAKLNRYIKSKPPIKSNTLSLRVERSLHEALMALAKKKGIPYAELIRACLTKIIEDEKKINK